MSIALDFCSDPLIRNAAQLFKVDPLATLETPRGFVALKVSPSDAPKAVKRKKEKAIDLTGDLFA